MKMELKTIRIQRVVEQQNLASVMKSGSLDVLATPQMIAWMEEAACLCLDLDQGKTSVGISMNVSHDMASPLGATITIEAKMVNVDGRKIRLSRHRTKAGEFRAIKFNPVIILRVLIWERFQNLRRIIAFISSFIA